MGFACGLVCLSGTMCGGSVPGPWGAPPPVLETDHILGAIDAPLTVIEYADAQCALCGLFADSVFPAIKAQYIDTGMVRWVFRHLPGDGHAQATAAAEAAECAADQDRFYDYVAGVFVNNGDLSDEALRQQAADLGLDLTRFDGCRADDSKLAKLQQDANSAAELEVVSIPTFFVGNEPVRGYRTAAQLGATIDEHLASP